MEYQVGQTVVIRSSHFYGEPYRFGIVTKVNKTQIEIDGEDRFMIGSGRKVGGVRGLYSDFLSEVTVMEAEERNAEVKREQEHKNRARALDNVSYSAWLSLDDAQLDTIIGILEAAKQPASQR